MIKTLLDADENPPEDTAVIIEETVLQPTPETAFASVVAAPAVDLHNDDGDVLEIPQTPASIPFEPQNASEIFDGQAAAPNAVPINETQTAESKPEEPLFAMSGAAFVPESSDETIRKSGLAYTAAIILLGSVIFMMVLGWFADLLFGSSPWGIVGGIVLGSIIGFVQFFRTTSQILKK
jgi:hypothetical protein